MYEIKLIKTHSDSPIVAIRNYIVCKRRRLWNSQPLTGKSLYLLFSGKVVTFDVATAQATNTVVTYGADEAIEGYVISSDEGGNFYQKNLYPKRTIKPKELLSLSTKQVYILISH